MTVVILSFVSGVVLLQLQPALPDTAWLWLLPCCVALAAWRRALAVPLAFAVGFLWAAGFAHLRLAERRALRVRRRKRGRKAAAEDPAVVVPQPVRAGRGFDGRDSRHRNSRRRALAFHRALAAAARQPESLRVRLRSVAHRARHRCDRLCAAEDESAAAGNSRYAGRPDRAGARACARSLQAAARRDAGRRNPRRARRWRPAL